VFGCYTFGQVLPYPKLFELYAIILEINPDNKEESDCIKKPILNVHVQNIACFLL